MKITDSIIIKTARFFLYLIIPYAVILTPLSAQNQLTAAVPEELKESPELYILESIAENLHSNLQVKSAPFARRLRYMENGETDITTGLLKNNEREKFIYYIDPPYKLKSNKTFFVKNGDSSKICKYEDLYDKTIGINIKSRYFSRFDNDEQIKKEATPSFKQNILKLLAGRIDAVIYTDGYGHLILNEMGVAGKVEAAEYHFAKNNPVYIGISKKSHLMNRIDEVEPVISGMIENGQIDCIIEDYYKSRNLPVPCYK